MKKLFLGLIILVFVFMVHISWAGKYCATPPFITQTVKPNILLVIDVSGSMAEDAYSGDYTGEEEGYFIPDRVYVYNSVNGYWEEANATPSSCPTGWWRRGINIRNAYYGSCLNYYYMKRIDLLRWALTGGRPDECNALDDEDCDPRFGCTGTTCILETYNGIRVKVPRSRVDRAVLFQMANLSNPPRLGALFYSGGLRQPKVYIGDYPYPVNQNRIGHADSQHPYTHLIRFINYISPWGSTATAPALWEAYDYFAQRNDHNYANGFEIAPGTFKDPHYFCNENGTNCKEAPCAKDFVILASDGQWNAGGNPIKSTCTIDTGYENYSADPVVPAYKMHHDVLRTFTTASGAQSEIRVSAVYTLGLFLGGTGEQSLKNVAMYGSFDLDHGNWPDGLSGYPQDTCKMDDCGYGKGSACTPLPSSSSDWDANGDKVPDTFLNAKTASEIKDSLLKFLTEILAKTASGTSVSVLTSRGLKGSSMVQAVFYPQKTFGTKSLTWVGYLYDYWLYNSFNVSNVREDTIQNKALDVCSSGRSPGGDYILNFKIDNSTGELTIEAYNSACNGTATTQATTYSSLDQVHPVWEAGEKLASTNASSRTIYTSADQPTLLPSSPSSLSELDSLPDALAQKLLGDDNRNGIIDDDNETTHLLSRSIGVVDLLDYVYGVDLDSYRSRTLDNGRVWKLGDIIYSTPQVVQYYQDNTSSHTAYNVVYVGANDGMLHAFRLGQPRFDGLASNQVVKLCKNSPETCDTTSLGEELWAFVPKNVLPYLRFLTAPNYCHLYYVDLQPYIVRLDENNDGIPEKVILIGGMRLGGGVGCDNATLCVTPPTDTCSDPRSYTSDNSSSCVGLSSYFALDVTDPEAPKFLWEFSDPDLGFTYSGPAWITYNGTHYVMFLSGPTNYKGEAGQGLHAFILKLSDNFTVDQVYKFPDDYSASCGGVDQKNFFASFNSTAFGGRLFTRGIDYNEDGNTDAVAFGISRKTGTKWQGNVGMVKITGDDPCSWDFVKIFNNALGPITAKVEYMKCFGHHFLYFGTGRWFYKEDSVGINASDVEKLYGVLIDGCLTGGNCNINETHTSSNICSKLPTSDTDLSKIAAWSQDLAPKDSTYFKERLTTDPTPTEENVILFTTFQPTADICSYGGRTRLWAMNCATGEGIGNSTCSGYTLSQPGGTIYLQLSRGNIEKFELSASSFTQEGGKATSWQTGVPPESPTQFLKPFQGREGQIIYWFEK